MEFIFYFVSSTGQLTSVAQNLLLILIIISFSIWASRIFLQIMRLGLFAISLRSRHLTQYDDWELTFGDIPLFSRDYFNRRTRENISQRRNNDNNNNEQISTWDARRVQRRVLDIHLNRQYCEFSEMGTRCSLKYIAKDDQNGYIYLFSGLDRKEFNDELNRIKKSQKEAQIIRKEKYKKYRIETRRKRRERLLFLKNQYKTKSKYNDIEALKFKPINNKISHMDLELSDKITPFSEELLNSFCTHSLNSKNIITKNSNGKISMDFNLENILDIDKRIPLVAILYGSDSDKSLKEISIFSWSSQFLRTLDIDKNVKPSSKSLYCSKQFIVGESYLEEMFDLYGNEEDVNGECIVCLSEKKDVLFLPCRHYCCCSVCLERLTSCPVCRRPISSYFHFS